MHAHVQQKWNQAITKLIKYKFPRVKQGARAILANWSLLFLTASPSGENTDIMLRGDVSSPSMSKNHCCPAYQPAEGLMRELPSARKIAKGTSAGRPC